MIRNTKKYRAELISISAIVKCLDCGTKLIIEKDEISFSVSASPCELCGTHGSITADVDCPHCKASKTIDIHAW